MNNIADSWKNKSIFLKQLQLNKEELSKPYPDHWNCFIGMINNLLLSNSTLKLLDVGCGSGVFYKLCLDNFGSKINYCGIDYSEEAIKIAKKEWKSSNFYCQDVFQITQEYINSYDVVHFGALLDVLENADTVLENVLNFNVPYIILGRVSIGKQKTVTTYKAYDEILTYKFTHDFENFKQLIHNYRYNIELQCGNNPTRMNYLLRSIKPQ